MKFDRTRIVNISLVVVAVGAAVTEALQTAPSPTTWVVLLSALFANLSKAFSKAPAKLELPPPPSEAPGK